MKDNLLAYLQIVKKNSGLTFRQISEQSNGLMSTRTVERLFKGETPMTTERFQCLDGILGLELYLQHHINGPETLSQVVVREVLSLNINQQLILLNLCREFNQTNQ